MTYEIVLQPEAQKHLKEWRKSGQKKILKKIADLFVELTEHPTYGTGQVEQLKGELSGLWSRRISKSERLIYAIEDEKVIVNVISLNGNYGDK